MSIDGVVRCRCLEDGRASPSPCPVEVVEGWVRPTIDHRDEWRAVFEWAETACPHRNFWLVEHRVLRRALLDAAGARGGRAAFPALYATLPTANDGEATPSDAANCLAELDALRELMRSGPMVVIVDDDTDAVVHVDEDDELVSLSDDCFLPPVPRIISIGRDYQITANPPIDGTVTTTWLGRDGVVRVRDGQGRELWQAREFTQTPDDDHWVFRDLLSGRAVRHRSPIPQVPPAHPRSSRLRAEIRPYDSDLALAGVAELRDLFDTSVRTGRSVFWI